MNRRKSILQACVIAALAVTAFAPPAFCRTGGGDALAEKIDAVMSEIYKPGGPGAAVIVRKDGKTLFRKGYGLADLELGAPIEPDMIFRIGSMTKQFTAVGVLMLAREGKLGLQDEIVKYLPDYPTQGRRITVEHLLTHTSGIQSYTDMAEWLPLMRKDMTLAELIALFKDKPMRFEPGERWEYNNSGYVLLGAIIEKVSGRTYAEFVEERIFKPLGMKHTSYGSAERIIPRRVSGYQKGMSGLVNAPYLSMTQPYAAGSLLSNVDDLAVWTEAVLSGKLVGREWLEKAFTPYSLKNGESTGYGYGWFVADYLGRPTVEHGGGINGFLSYGIAFPEDNLYVAVLTNGVIEERAPEPRAVKIAGLALGLTEPERKTVALAAEDLEPLVGVYEAPAEGDRYITREGTKLYSQRSGSGKNELLAASAVEFFFPDNPSRITFVKDAAGTVTGLRVKSRYGPALVYARTDRPFPSPKKEIVLDPNIYDAYVGDYELAPGFIITIVRRDSKLIAQATGQPELELFPESETKFFPTVVEAQIEFVKDASGKVTGLVLTQGGQVMPAKKIK